MLQRTAADISEQGLKNTEMRRMDAEELEFPDASFDYVLCGFSFFLFANQDRALAEFARVLRPHGKLGLTPSGAPGRLADRPTDWCSELLQIYRLTKQLSESGFVDIQIMPEEAEFVYADEEEWWASQWSHLRRGPRRRWNRKPWNDSRPISSNGSAHSSNPMESTSGTGRYSPWRLSQRGSCRFPHWPGTAHLPTHHPQP